MALPDAVQDVARRLPAAAARLSGVPGSGGPLSAAEAEDVVAMLATLEAALNDGDQATNRTADALLSDDALRAPTLRLVAIAVRGTKPSDPPAYRDVAGRAMRVCAWLLTSETPPMRRAMALLAFGRKLLRMDTLQCCSRILSSGADWVAALAAAGAAAAEDEGANAAVAYGPPLVSSLFYWAMRTDVAAELARTGRQLKQWRQLQQQFAGELAAALRDSHVLEHTARWALHAQLAESVGWLPQGAAGRPLSVIFTHFVYAVELSAALDAQGGAPGPALGEALSGPCVRHALLSMGVAALCAADGGASYGLPPELLLRLPLLGLNFAPIVRGAPGKQRLAKVVLVSLMGVLGGSTDAAAAGPPRDWRLAAALLHRIVLLPSAPLGVAAALAGGLLPLWERLLRCAGRQPDCAEAPLLTHMLANHAPFWDLMAYGDLREGAALVATWGKLLRTLAVPQLLWDVGGGDAMGGGSSRTALAVFLAKCAMQLLTVAFGRLKTTDLLDLDGVKAPAQLQLARLVSFAVCDWLPPLARLAHEGMQLTALGGLASARHVSGSEFAVLAWVPTLAWLCRTRSTAGAGWQQLLLQELGAVSLLGAACQDALGMTAASGGAPGPWRYLLGSCCLLAAAFPAWSPQLFRAIEAELRGCPGDEAAGMVVAAAALARQAELWVAGGGEDGAELGRAAIRALGGPIIPIAVVWALLPSSPADARALLRTCANPACDNLAGESEAALPLRACGRCGAAWYCRRECLVSHWRSGHKEACVPFPAPSSPIKRRPRVSHPRIVLGSGQEAWVAMALPDAVRDVARRLPAAAARLAGVPGSGGPLSAEEAEDVAAMLATLEAALNDGDQATNRTADALLSDDALRVPTLRLVAFAVRGTKPSDPPAFRDVAGRAMRVCASLLTSEMPPHQRAMALLAFGRKLLRMDTLQCCSRMLSSGADWVAALTAAGAAEAGEEGANAAVTYGPPLVSSLLGWAMRTDVAAEPARTGHELWRQQWRQLQQQFAGELAAALRDSHVLEHTARWALHVQLAESAGWLPQGAAGRPLSVMITQFASVWRLSAALNAQEGAPGPALGEALSGPCVRHALLSLGVAALCAADGGASYGLPPKLLLRLPLLGLNFAPIVRGAPGKQRLAQVVLVSLMRVLGGSIDGAAAGPPRNWRLAAALLHRLGRFAVASAQAWAEEGAAEAGLPQLVLEEAGTIQVAWRALVQLAQLMEDHAADDAAALAEAGAAWWRLAVDVTTHCVRWAAPWELEQLAKLLDSTWRPQRLLRPAAPRVVAAALAGGLLPLWERLLRCAGRQPDCAEAALLSHMLASPANHARIWDLLAYGDVRQAAALVATWGKLLRTLAVPQLLCSISMGGAMDDGSGHTALACALVDFAMDLLTSSFDRLAEAGLPHPDGMDSSAPQLQLALLVSYAVCDWLPPLARLANEGLQLTALSGPSAAGAGWRQVLLQEIGAVPLLGATCQYTLGMVSTYGGVPRTWRYLLRGCCWLAVTCPGELFRAMEAELRGRPGDEAAAMVAAAAALPGRKASGRRGGRKQLLLQPPATTVGPSLVGSALAGMALPDAVQDVARRLPAAPARLSGVPGSGGPLSAAEAEDVVAMLATLEAALNDGDQATNRTADALLSDDGLRVPMLRLVAFAVRGTKPSDPPAYRHVADRAMRVCESLLPSETPPMRRTMALLAFGRKLLRMDTLQCCSRMLSSGADWVEALAAAGGAGARGEGANAAITYGPQLANSLLQLALRTDVAAELARTERQLKQWRQLQQQFAAELAAALRDSHLLEHTARWTLHVQLAESARWLPQGVASIPLTVVAAQYATAGLLATAVNAQGGAHEPALGEALSGPCVRHAVLSLGVAALCAADGGTSYGLPPELLLRLPLLGLNFAPIVRGAPGKQRLSKCVLVSLMQVLGGSIAPAGPPRDWRLAAALLHRIGRFAVASAQAWVEDGVEAGLPQLLLEEAGILPVAVEVLTQLPRLHDLEQAVPAAPVEVDAARWRLAVDVATHCMRWASPKEVELLARLLSIGGWPLSADVLLPPVAPLAATAALAGGLLPLWERLLRCAGRQPDCAEAALLSHVLTFPANHAPFWDLLAYSDVRQAAALVATWGQLLRTLAVPQLLWSVGGGDAMGGGSSRTALACGLVDFAVDMLTLASYRLRTAGKLDPDGAPASAAQLQLARLATYTVCEWLPPLALLAREGAPALKRAARLPGVEYVAECVSNVLVWSSVLSRLSLGWSGVGWTGSAPAGAAGPAVSVAAAAAGAGWRQLLLQELGAVPLLGAACQDALGSSSGNSQEDADTWYLLLESCCWLIAACPGEVRLAVLAAAAEVAAAAGSGSGRGGGGSGGAGPGGGRRRGGRGDGPSRDAPHPPPAWSPQLFRALEAEVRGRLGKEAGAVGAAATALVNQAELWVAGGGTELARSGAARGDPTVPGAVARALLTSAPADARALLRTCANPACDNLAGDSEAALPLRACGRCGAAWYCRRECLASHWHSGHKEACVARGEAAGVMAGPGQPEA
ncbi:hypothetical protein TSOC_010962 [Tetrabaena socialis]|uniref:phytol kinase n=1 Tax=Tetrabaena socialis TaxID=47790 RepID=A0A2J7ZRW7_9CHLO|nr:hypothetical protein TSOC_010962 [Tetrabaena socialis]|eukprot:PNH03012.1 hypothetical protein TSOC_010962 [Tetrabaena socialis]